MIYIAFVLPVTLSFYDQNSLYIIIVDTVLTFIFLFDIIISFFRVYTNDKYKLVTSKKKIAINYLKCWFWIDLIAFIPIYLIVNKMPSINQWMKVFKLTKVFNIVYLIRALKVIRNACQKETRSTFIGYQFFKTNNEVFYYQILTNIITLHFITCLAYSIPLNFSPEVNWIVLRQIQNRTTFEKYLFSLHWIVETFITVGYGETPIT